MFAKTVDFLRRRPARWVMWYICLHPATSAYLVILVAVNMVIKFGLSSAQAGAIELEISTNISNLSQHPIVSLLGSSLVVNGSLLCPGVILGVGCGMAWLERRHGSLRALGAFLVGHIGATLLVVPVILCGFWGEYYAPNVSHAYDYGISYGALTIAGVVTGLLADRFRPTWILVLTGYLLNMFLDGADPPSFTSFGHLFSIVIGLAIAVRIIALQRRHS